MGARSAGVLLQPVLERVALEYQEYEDSGSQVWDTLIDVSARPEWLKELAKQTRARGVSSFVRKQATSKALGMSSRESQGPARPPPSPDERVKVGCKGV